MYGSKPQLLLRIRKKRNNFSKYISKYLAVFMHLNRNWTAGHTLTNPIYWYESSVVAQCKWSLLQYLCCWKMSLSNSKQHDLWFTTRNRHVDGSRFSPLISTTLLHAFGFFRDDILHTWLVSSSVWMAVASSRTVPTNMPIVASDITKHSPPRHYSVFLFLFSVIFRDDFDV